MDIRRWCGVLAAGAVLLSSSIIMAPPEPARAALTNVWPASADGEIYPTLSTTDALFAYVTSDFRGGRVCIVAPTGTGNCESPAWGSPNVLIGIGTLFSLIEGPTLRAGDYRLMTEAPRPAGQPGWDPVAYSDVFTIYPCEVDDSCASTVGREDADRFKAANERLGEYVQDACDDAQPDEGDTIKGGVNAIASRSLSSQVSFIASFGIGAGLGAIGMIEVTSYNDAAKKILMMLQCEVAAMHRDIANDPPDPVYATVQPPVFSTFELTGRPVVDELIDALDEQAAYGIASRIAWERAQGAEADGDLVSAQLQYDAVATYTAQLAAAVRRTVAALRGAAASGDPAFAGTPIADAEELADLQEFTTRVATSGLTAAERQLLVEAGLSDADIAGATTWLSNVPDGLVPGRTRAELLRATADLMEPEIAEIDAFARHVASVRVPLPPNQRPTAAFTRTPTAGQAPLTVTFDGRSSSDPDGTIASYHWQFGDGATATGATTTHTFTTPAEYGVVLTVTDNDGAIDDQIASVTATASPIDVPPIPGFTLAWSDTVPALAILTSVSTDSDGSIVETNWDLGDGTTTSGPSVEHVFGAGTWTVRLEVVDDDGLTAEFVQTVTVVAGNSPPVAVASAVPSSTDPLTFTFDGAASNDADGTITTHFWEFGDGSTSTLATVDHTYASAGTYTARLTITDDQGATAIAVGDVQINRAPVPVVSIDRGSGTAPLAVRFDAQASSDPDGAIVSYEWDLDDGTTATGPTVLHTYDTPGSYHPTLTITDDDGATGEATGLIEVRPNFAPTAGPNTHTTTGTLAFDLLATAADPDGDPISVGEVTAPSNGSLDCDPLGGCLYVAEPGFVGTDAFDYRSSDGRLDSDPATITIEVTETITPPGELAAFDDSAVTTEGVPTDVDTLANDLGDGLRLVSNTTPEHGTATCQPDGGCTYVPDAGFVGTDHFTYEITDPNERVATATVRIRIAATARHVPSVDGRAGPPTDTGTTVERGGDGRWWAGAKVTPAGADPVGTLERELEVDLTGPHQVRAATIRTAPGWSVVGSTPTSIDVVAGSEATLGESVVQPLPRPSSPVSQGTGGDGHVPILVGSRAYAFFHHTYPTSVTCIERTTGARCPGYPIQVGWNSDNIPGQGAVVGSRIYTRLDSPGYMAFSLFCWDTATDATCGARILERFPTQTYSSTGSAPVVVGDEVWALGRSGRLHCIAGATGQDCAVSAIDTGIRSTGEYFDIVANGSHVFVKGTENLVACIDVALGRNCTGWPTPRHLVDGRDLVTRYTATGVADGVCLVGSGFGTCVAEAGGPSIPIDPWYAAGAYYNEQQTADTGTRTFYAALGVPGLGCWDWTTMAACVGDHFDLNGWTQFDVTGNQLPSGYGAVWDGTCAVAVGDPGLVYTVAAGGASPCSGSGQAARTEPVDLRLQRCTNDVGAASWRDIVVSGVDLGIGVDLTSLVIFVRDASTNEVVASREMVGTAGTIDLADVVASEHPALVMEASAVSVAGDPAWSDGRQPVVQLRWTSDPAAVCFRTSTVVECGASPTTIGVVGTTDDREDAAELTLSDGATCDPPNSDPVAEPGSYATERGEPIVIELTGYDEDGDPVLATVLTPPSNGDLVPVSTTIRALAPPPARYTYTPDPDFVGTDQLTFTVTDGWADSAPATVSIVVSDTTDSSTTTTTTTTTSTTSTTTTTVVPTTTTTQGTDPTTTSNPTTTQVVDPTTTQRTDPTTTSAAPSTSAVTGPSSSVAGGGVGPTSTVLTPVGELPTTGGGSQTVQWAGALIALGALALLASRRRGASA